MGLSVPITPRCDRFGPQRDRSPFPPPHEVTRGRDAACHEFLRDGGWLLDARTQFHYLATVIIPAVAHARVGAGSAHAHTVRNAKRRPRWQTTRHGIWALAYYRPACPSKRSLPTSMCGSLRCSPTSSRCLTPRSHCKTNTQRPRSAGVGGARLSARARRGRLRSLGRPRPPLFRSVVEPCVERESARFLVTN